MPETGLTYATLCAVGTGLLWCGIGVLISKVTSRGTDFPCFMAGSYVVTALLALVLFPRHTLLLTGPVPRLWNTIGVLLAAGLLSSTGLLLLNRAMALGPHGASWTIAQSALVVPFAVGVLLWHDQSTALNLCGVAAILGALIAFGMARARRDHDTHPESGKWFAFALATLAVFGLQQTLMTIPSRWPDWSDAVRLRIPLFTTGCAICYVIVTLHRGGWPPFKFRKEHLILPCIALPSQFLLFLALDISAEYGRTGLVYPLTVGTCIVSFALYSALVLREPLSRCTLAGMVMGAVGVVLVALR